MRIESVLAALSFAVSESRRRYKYLTKEEDRVSVDLLAESYTILNFKNSEKIVYSGGVFTFEEIEDPKEDFEGGKVSLRVDELHKLYGDFYHIKELYSKLRKEEMEREMEIELSKLYNKFVSLHSD